MNDMCMFDSEGNYVEGEQCDGCGACFFWDKTQEEDDNLEE